MTSVLANYAQNPNAVKVAVLSGGNGSNSTTNLAIATIDPRYGNTFTIDTRGLTIGPDVPLQKRVYIRLQLAKPKIGALRPGKLIHISVNFAVGIGAPESVTLSFDTSVGKNLQTLATSGGGSYNASFSLIADGTQFQVLGTSIDWGWD
jgi:hypothetical protein